MFDVTKYGEVDDHDHEGKNPRNGRNQSPDQRAEYPCTAADEESNEGESTSDRVENHGMRETVNSMS